ncbi:MAG: secretin N-terminal domain-containing protein [Verrucomicrobiota bacterium]
MKTIIKLLLAAVLTAGTFKAFAQQSDAAPPEVSEISTNAPATTATDDSTLGLRMNFRNVPLEMILDYLSDAAGFIIVIDTSVRGNVSVISTHPMSKDEAVDLLNSVLNQNGYAAIRNGRTLTIMDKNDAKTRDIPVKTGNDPDAIPSNDEIVTQIIPIRYVEAEQLVTDLSSFVSPQATIVANEAGNAIVITDTQANIRHLTEIIKAVDSSAEGETEIRVFHLQYASPDDVANELGQIFPSGNSSSGAQTPIRFNGGGGGPGGFFARMMAANAGGNNNSQNSRAQKQSQVVAVSDPRTQSVIVTASKDLMEQIGGMMEQLDVPSARDQKVYVFHMNNGDPQQALQVLQNMFQTSSTSRSGNGSSSSSSENSALMQREQNNATTTSTSSSSTSSSFTGSGATRSGAAQY